MSGTSQRKKTSAKRVTAKAQRTPLMVSVRERLLRLPRLVRILITAAFAIAVTLDVVVLFYVVDAQFIVDPAIYYIPVIVGCLFGFAMYILGWRILVGTVGEVNIAGNEALWYIVVGVLALIVAAFWFVQTMTIARMPI